MGFKLSAKITIILALFLISRVAGAVQVPWSYEWYRAYADGYAVLHGGGDEWLTDETTGPAPPLYAEVEDYTGDAFRAWSTIETSLMETYAYIGGYELIGTDAYATGEFRGQYTADRPFFKISYDYIYYSFHSQTDTVYSKAWLKIDDLTNPENLFDGTFELSSNTGSGVLTIPVPVGHELEVNFGINSRSSTRWDSGHLSFNYNMAVTPEPVSSVLFLSGGATLAIGYFRKRKKSA